MLDCETVATVCRARVTLGAAEKLMCWLRERGASAGQSAAAALEAGMPVARLELLAVWWAREQGAARADAVAVAVAVAAAAAG